MSRAEGNARVIRLDDYRKSKRSSDVAIELRLLSSDEVEYTLPTLSTAEAFQALIGCYLLAGELLATLKGELECIKDHY